MNKSKDQPQDKHVTYIVVVHGIGEQRKNECVLNVVNRFAEARRDAKEDDNRDVLTLGKASGQTGLPKVPVTEQPWVEFKGIPASPNAPTPSKPFLGEPATCGTNLRFVDLCWSDVMQDSIEHVGQDVDLWAKGLLGRLLRKHEAAVEADKPAAQVPLWIRRVLYILTDTLVLVRFAMNFRFKEMKELVFVKFLGDVQLYGEYSRCRGQAVRRFHDMMAKVEAVHYARELRDREGEQPRVPRYVIISHSLGSVMSLDALLYASATSAVRLGRESGCKGWEFPGYLRKRCKLAPPDTRWIQRVRSFVTLGSPVDKYLTIWWSNYGYLRKCVRRIRKPEQKIAHFNYCDELDPVGHELDVVRQTPVYKAVFECREDVVFNRYSVPGVAHNKYWTDQGLFRWVIDGAVDDVNKRGAEQPRWFRRGAYWKLLFWLYSLVPLLVLLGTYASLSLAFQADGWRTTAISAAVFSFLVFFGSRLIDLSTWWRQIQRQKSSRFWREPCPPKEPCRPTKQERKSRRRGGVVFWVLAFTVPLACAALTCVASHKFTSRLSEVHGPLWSAPFPPCSSESCAVRLLVVLTVFVAAGVLVASRRLPAAYRVPAHDPKYRTKIETAFMLVSGLATMVLALLLASRFACPYLALAASIPAEHTYRLPTPWLGQLVLFGILATPLYGYRLYCFLTVKYLLRPGRPQEIDYEAYAPDTSGGGIAEGCGSAS